MFGVIKLLEKFVFKKRSIYISKNSFIYIENKKGENEK
jgi:hypothetical protein